MAYQDTDAPKANGRASESSQLPMYKADFTDQEATCLVTTALRRLWLVSPPLRSEQTTKDPSTERGKDFELAFESSINYITGAISPERAWNDAIWRRRTRYKLLEAPGAVPCSGPQSVPLVEWRNRILAKYKQVFEDFQKVILEKDGTLKECRVRDFGVEAVQNIEFPTEEQPGPHILKIERNAFVYPAYVAPGVTITVAVDDETHSWSSDGPPCTVGLWVQDDKEMVVTVNVEGDVSLEDRKNLAAVLVLGQCHMIPESEMALRPYPPPADKPIEPNMPEAAAEAAHLARAIWLQGGDAVDNPSFDGVYERVEEETTPAAADGSASPPGTLYSPLPDGRTIRILVIEPGSREEALQTRLQVVSLRDAPRYEALSYTWGAPDDKVELACSSTLVLVPKNLVGALTRLRHPERPRHVWADAVCINQQDIEERGQQVSIMREIFHAAARVVVWVGEDPSGYAATAFTTVCNIVHSWKPSGDRLRYTSYDYAFDSMSAEEIEELQKNVSYEDWAALQGFFESTYFRRFWIVQELALSQSAIVIWGDHHIAWPLVGICAAWLLTKGWNFHIEAPLGAAYNAFFIYVLPIAQYTPISRFSKIDFSVVLGMTVGSFDSTDPRDRIYALLGMPFSGNDPESGLIIQPDYTESLLSVYAKATRRILTQDQHLRVLSSVQHGSEVNPDRPSWVPQWDKPYEAEPLALRQEQGYYANGGELFCPDEETFSADGQSLFLTGLECARVAKVCEPFRKGHILITSLERKKDRDAMIRLIGALLREENRFRSSWSSKQEQYVIYGWVHPEIQAKMNNSDWKGAMATSEPGKYGMRASVETLTSERAQSDHLGDFLMYWRERCDWRADEILHDQFFDHLRMLDASSMKMELTLCAFNAFWGRRIFHCEDGTIGLGPAAMRPGDVIVVLFGGIVPYVLRPRSKSGWQFVGECFVPSMMQGEAVEAAGILKSDEFQREDGALKLDVDWSQEGGPRFQRKVGEDNIKRFQIV
jgi:hypothetical protein